MLLGHSAGTTVHGFRGYAAGAAVPTVQQILDGAAPVNSAAVRVDLAPGTKFRYSGGGTLISQLALTERSKRPYPQYLCDRPTARRVLPLDARERDGRLQMHERPQSDVRSRARVASHATIPRSHPRHPRRLMEVEEV